jgi:F0F1-type ATP synthase epsilon subunit
MAFNFFPAKKTFHVTVLDNEETVFDDEVVTLSSTNQRGNFDILSLHSNFITIIQKELILRQEDKTTKRIKINQAVMQCLNHSVKIFLGI